MYTRLLLSAVLHICGAIAAQPSAPEPLAAPLRDLKFGNLNFLHTTDTHGWHAGHLLEASFSADWGDYIDFAGRLREKIEADGGDLLVVDTGDRIEGNGLYDGDEPKGYHTFKIFKEQHIDLICSGNHELYKQNSSENELHITVPAYHDSYLASNLDIYDAEQRKFIPLAPRYKKFTTKNQGIRIMSFGFLYNFKGNYNNTVVIPVEKVIQEQWFQDAIRDRNVDLFVVIGHAEIRSDELSAIYKAIRGVQWDIPIQFFGGHFHIRDYKKFDSKAYGLASGRFMETIGFQSINGITGPQSVSPASSPTFFRSYIDNNLYSYYHHSGHNASTFHSAHGRNVSKMIGQARSELKLDTTFGCAPQDLWMSRAPYPSNNSIFSWLEQQVFPDTVSSPDRAEKARIVMTNTGAIRFDIFKGAFTKDSTFIVSPFTSGFHYLKDVPYEKASKVIRILNHEGNIVETSSMSKLLETWRLAPPEQWTRRSTRESSQRHHSSEAEYPSPHVNMDKKEHLQIPINHSPDLPSSSTAISPKSHSSSPDNSLIPGYTTTDDAGTDGDDTIHSPIKFYRVPNVIQSLIIPQSSSSPSDVPLTKTGSDPERVDLVFNEFIQQYVLLALRFLGAEYTDTDVEQYLPGENLTNLLSRWVSENWSENCY